MDIFAGDEMAATAILGRLVHQAHLLNIDGRSYCLKNFERLLKDGKKDKKGSREIDENLNHSISQLKLTAIIIYALVAYEDFAFYLICPIAVGFSQLNK